MDGEGQTAYWAAEQDGEDAVQVKEPQHEKGVAEGHEEQEPLMSAGKDEHVYFSVPVPALK